MKKIFFVFIMLFIFVNTIVQAKAVDLDFNNGFHDQGYVQSTTFKSYVFDNKLDGNVGDAPGQVIFEKKMNVESIYLSSIMRKSGSFVYATTFGFACYDELGKIIQRQEIKTELGVKIERFYNIDCKNVKTIKIEKTSLSGSGLALGIEEMDFFGEEPLTYDPVENVVVSNITDNSFDINFENPNSKALIANEIYLDDLLIHQSSIISSYKFKDLRPNTTYKLKINTVYKDGQKVSYETSVTTTIKKEPPTDVTNLEIVYENGAAKLTYNIPSNATSVKIYKNSILLDDVKTNSYTDDAVEVSRTYTYKVVAVNDFGQAPGVTKSITIPNKEITKLKAIPTSDRVDLSWQLPSANGFKHVVIYRTNLSQSSEKSIFKSLFSSTKEESLFETNGTYFNDLTVKSDTKYRYRVSSVYKDETPGVSVEVTTLKIKVENGNVEENENGDYTVNWSAPTTGKIKILVGGELYVTVEASSKKYTIPGKDMKYTAFGAPDVTLVPIAEDGTEGGATKPGGTDLPPMDGVFSGNDLLKTTMQLVALIGGILLLSLSFRVAPKIIRLIRKSLSKQKDNAIYDGNRRRVQ